MPDTTYRVLIDFDTNVGALGAKMGGLAASMGSAHGGMMSLGDAAATMGSKVANAADGALTKLEGMAMSFAKIGAAAVVGGAAYAVAKLNNDLEETQISLATILAMNGQSSDFESGFARSGTLMKELRADAAALPGTFSDLNGIFNAMSVPAFQAGLDPERLRELSGEAMVAAKAFKLPFDQAGREAQQLLQGHAGGHNIFGSLLGLSGDAAQKFNKMGAGARADELMKKLDSPAIHGALGKQATSFDSAMSTAVEDLKTFATLATKPLFETVKNDLVGVHNWLDTNSDKTEHFASVVGGRLVQAWTFVADQVRWVGLHFDGITKSIEHFSSGEGLKKIGRDLAFLGAAQMGLKMAPSMLSGLGSMGGAAGGAAGVGGAAMGGFGAAALVGAAVAGAGAFDILTDKTSFFHAQAERDFEALKIDFEKLTATGAPLGEALRGVADVMGSELLMSLHAVGDVAAYISDGWGVAYDAGLQLYNGANHAASALGDLASAVADKYAPEVRVAKDWTETAGEKVGEFAGEVESLGELSKYASFSMDSFSVSIGKMLTTIGEAGGGGKAKESAADNFHGQKKPATPAGGGGGGGGQHIQKVEIVVSSNQDPSRIARLTLAALMDVQRNPKQSTGARDWSSPKP